MYPSHKYARFLAITSVFSNNSGWTHQENDHVRVTSAIPNHLLCISYSEVMYRVALWWTFWYFEGDGRVISPLPRNKSSCISSTTNVTELCGLEVKTATGSLSAFGDSSMQTPSKSRIRQGCHSAGPDVSGNKGSPPSAQSQSQKGVKVALK